MRRAAACRRTRPRAGSRTSRSRRASARTCRSSRRTPRGCRPARSRARGAAAARRPARRGATAPAWYALRDAAHDSGTVRRGLLSRRTAARRPRLGGVRGAAGAASRAVSRSPRSCGRRTRPPASTTTRRGSVGRTRPHRAARSATTRTSRARRMPGPTGGDPGERVRREGAWLAERGVSPTLFCGGGLVHGPRCRARMRRARLRGLHAARDPAAVPPSRRRVGRARLPRPDRGRRIDAVRRADVARRRRPRAVRWSGRASLRVSTRTSTTPTSSSRAGGR